MRRTKRWKNQRRHVCISRLLEPKERLSYLVSGYIRECIIDSIVPIDILGIIHSNCCILPDKSSQIIAITHSITSAIHDYLNLPQNKCPFSESEDMNILQHIYIRGGALRDCCLLRTINDVDIVLDSNSLSKQYVQHLTTYHSSPHSDTPAVKIQHRKCIFYRHYMNKHDQSQGVPEHFYMERFYLSQNRNQQETVSFKHHKIVRFLADIANSNYMINTRFLCDIISKATYCAAVQTSFRFTMSRRRSMHWKMQVTPIQEKDPYIFDIVSGPEGWYSADDAMPCFTEFCGKKVVNAITAKIKRHEMSTNPISVPIYPFSFDLKYYDFTINAMHVSLDAVFNAGKYSNWSDLVSLNYPINAINEFNLVALHDLKHKILAPPSFDVITVESAEHYFWRFVKLARKFYLKMDQFVWKVHREYINQTVKNYKIWFQDNNDYIAKDVRRVFMDKLFHIDGQQNSNSKEHPIYDVLHVFRFIGFEKLFKRKLALCFEFEMDFRRCFTKSSKSGRSFCGRSKKCLLRFGYPKILATEPPSLYCFACEQMGQCLHIEDDDYGFCPCCKSWACKAIVSLERYLYVKPKQGYAGWHGMEHNGYLMDYNPHEGFPKRCNRYVMNNCNKVKAKTRWISKNRSKVKSYSKRKMDKKRHAKSNKKYKNRYMLSSQF
eukprot:484618_1